MTQNSSAKVPVSAPTPPPFSPFSAFTSAPSASQGNTPQPPQYQQSAFSAPPKPAADPFAALASPSFNSKPATPIPTQPAASNDDDEWSFSSALPSEAPVLPREHKAVISNTSLKIDMLANRTTASANNLSLLFAFTNNIAQPVSELHFQLAVTKVRIHISRTILVQPYRSSANINISQRDTSCN